MSHQAAFIPSLAVGMFSPKTEGTRHKQLGYTDIEISIFTPKGFEGCVIVKLLT
jgi:hypothetical protein